MKFQKLLLTAIIAFQTSTVFAHEGEKHEGMKMDEKQSNEHAQKHVKGVPDQVKKYFKDGEVELVHKFLTPEQMKNIEKDSGVKPEGYFHTFIAIGKKNGKKTQLGAGTLVKIDGKKPIEFAVIYNNKLVIKDILPIKNTEAIKYFLSEFKGKDHDQAFSVGKDLKYSGKDLDLAKKVAQSIKLDIITVQTLWGKSHSHSH